MLISRLWKARFVRIFTTTSNLCLGEYPQTVAGLKIVVTKLLDEYFDKIFSHCALYLE